MNEKIGSILKWAVVGNMMHLIAAAFFSQINKENMAMVISVAVISLVIWLVAGFKLGTAVLKGKETDFLLYGFLCVLPILIYTVGAMVLQGSAVDLSTFQNYSLFYFLGAPALFWNTPFYAIMHLFSESNMYMQMNMNMLLVVVVSFVGALAGRNFRIQQLKKSKRKQID